MGEQLQHFDSAPVQKPQGDRLPYSDLQIEQNLKHIETSEALYEENPIIWLKGSIAFETGRGASEISDEALAERFLNGGNLVWKPEVIEITRIYLRNKRLCP